jgi:hypothetical protein
MMGFDPLGPAWKGAGGGTTGAGVVEAFGEVEEVVPPSGAGAGAAGGTGDVELVPEVAAGWIGCGEVEDSAIG